MKEGVFSTYLYRYIYDNDVKLIINLDLVPYDFVNNYTDI